MALKLSKTSVDEAELDITSFMNLMIVLVPVLLLSLTFTNVTVHQLKLPDLTGGMSQTEQAMAEFEIAIDEQGLSVYYPADTLVQHIPKRQVDGMTDHDFVTLASVVQGIKQQLPERKDVVLKSAANVSYQTLVSAMDTVKSYKTVVAASLVEVELFPQVSLVNLAQ
ncbi:hypothetical protein SIN8267_02654 [Sinobacterium norvegicum]|uniref:Biopolymer transporter ExbD n=1 Tax=Sinobacterium norvegicum TaxID=1641715 RepID=A0ABN8EJG9_9GAMM|nr:biopolymer transporter ExbD [Sinobacterium norvegicum]CAH0992522.1 hypothetical protein SIN8267_02654 [Sinobacterium norvegicum]